MGQIYNLKKLNLLKSFSIYTAGNLLTQSINFFLLPVFTHYLTPSDYGILTLISTITSFITPLILISIDGSISIEFYKKKFGQPATYITSALVLSFISTLFVSLIMLLISNKIQQQLFIPVFWLDIIPVMCFFEVVRTLNLMVFQINEKPMLYAGYSLSNTLGNLLLALFFIILLKYNYEGRLYGQYCIAIIYFFLGLYILYKRDLLCKNISKLMMKDIIEFGLPLIPHAIGFSIINLADRFFISYYAGNYQLGIYSLSYTLGSIIVIIAVAFNNAWTPHFYKLLQEDTIQSKLKIVKITYWYVLILFLLTIGLVIISSFIFNKIIDSKFQLGLKFVPWIAFSSFFFGCYLAFTNYIFYLKRTKTFAYVSIMNIILNLILNLILIKHYGAIGAAYATFLSFFLFALIIAIIAIKIYPMPWMNITANKL